MVPNDEHEAAPWATASEAIHLGAQKESIAGSVDANASGAQLDPVVIQGLRTLTMLVNHANNLAGAADHRYAVAVLQTLHDGGYVLVADRIYDWALINKWPSRGAARLREIAEKIAKGTRPRLKGPWPLRADILDMWRSEASESAE